MYTPLGPDTVETPLGSGRMERCVDNICEFYVSMLILGK